MKRVKSKDCSSIKKSRTIYYLPIIKRIHMFFIFSTYYSHLISHLIHINNYFDSREYIYLILTKKEALKYSLKLASVNLLITILHDG